MAHLFIKDIKPGMQINETYMVTQPVLRNTTRGDLYIAMFLSDRTGKVNSRMWQATQEIYSKIPSEGFVQIRAKSELYQNAMQLVLNDLIVIDADNVDLSDYMPRTEKNVTQMFDELKEMLAPITDPTLKKLIANFLEDTPLMKQFCIAPSAMQMHHAYLGGLLEHTHSMLKVATSILPIYPRIQGDLVLAAVFLHDIAKTTELSYKMGFSYTDAGQLLGHIILGIEMINDKAAALEEKGTTPNQAVIDNLLHIIASHHGCYEFGSPKLPATAEAFMVNYIDDLDAKMNQVTNLIENDPGDSNWTAYQRPLETRLYRNRPLAQE
jgi:3'-5' exoribonuclease